MDSTLTITNGFPGRGNETARRRRSLLAVSLGVSLLLWALAIGAAQPSRAAAAPETSAEIASQLHGAHFSEPLITTKPTTHDEDIALLRAVSDYDQRTSPDDVSSLTGFLSRYPDSGWAPALLTNLGLSYLHYGYFSLAVDSWQKAWALGRHATAPDARALVDRSVSELARLYASLGQIENLAALFDEIGDRPVSGSATEALQVARETLSLAHNDPRHLFICGPFALRSLMLTQGKGQDQGNFVLSYRAGPDGTSLAEVAQLADQLKFPYRLVFRKPGQSVPVPSVVHWKVGHFGAITEEANGRFHVEDPVAPGTGLWVTRAALDAETSGYYLVPAAARAKTEWRDVSAEEAGRIRGKGATNGTPPGDPGDPLANDGDNDCPMCGYNIKEASVSLTLSDTPVGYVPPIGPSAKVRITYNQREDSQPQNFSFFNVSPKWTFNWLGYVTDDPTNAGGNVSRYLSGGGAYHYTGYSSITGKFAAQYDDGSILVLVSQSPITYQRQLADGGTEVYAESDGSTGYPRRVFLSQVIDPQGNAATLNYDDQKRLVSLTDATGRQTTFTYGLADRPLLITQITDPFGRSASLTYDANGRLSSITDILGLTSSFTYDANSLVNSMTTPYGATNFSYTAPGTSSPPRFVQVTDPLGYSEREEWLEPAPVPTSDPAALVPQGMPTALTNNFLEYRNSFHWDKDAYIAAGCTPSGGCNYDLARIRHFAHLAGAATTKSTTLESEKYPLENRVWFTYPGQTSGTYSGTIQQPNAVGRVLDDGATQLSQYSYDTAGYFKVTKAIDPAGRTTSFVYANGIDLLGVKQTTAVGVETTIAEFTYNSQHLPISFTDAAGATYYFTYNSVGQITSGTNPLGKIESYDYDTNGNLIGITDANNVIVASYTYDLAARVASYTDSEGWTILYEYDDADRVAKITYPDGSFDQYTYDKLDLISAKSREGRIWNYEYDANRRRIKAVYPNGGENIFTYNGVRKIKSYVDQLGNVTNWNYDFQGRVRQKIYPDLTEQIFQYDSASSRLIFSIDAKHQAKHYSYTIDNRLAAIEYLNTMVPTLGVSIQYDSFFPRVVAITDSIGTTQFQYAQLGTPGALQVSKEISSLPNRGIDYSYDEMGRLALRSVAGSGPESFEYDEIGRLVSHGSDLGSFSIEYLGETNQPTRRSLLGSSLQTAWQYLPNDGDRRLSGIENTGPISGQYSNFTFKTTADNFIVSASATSDALSNYPITGLSRGLFNKLNQVVLRNTYRYQYDANGNLTSDGIRSFVWDAEDRLVEISYPGEPGKRTVFTYDGSGRRASISDTAVGGSPTITTSYIWCGDRPCQVRDSNDVLIRSYYAEGEFLPGTPTERRFYGSDQLGTVRRVFESGGTSPAYEYDPYGVPLQSQPPATDYAFAGLRYHQASGLYLSSSRAYDPLSGTWLTRDPIGELASPDGNLYPYVGGNPIGHIDPNGRNPLLIIGGIALLSTLLTPQPANAPGPCDTPIPESPFAPALNGALAGVNLGPVLALIGRGFGGTIVEQALLGAAKRGAGPVAGGGARLENLSASEITRIQNAATRTRTQVTVVGSRAQGTARANSDWDYLLPEGTRGSTRHSLRSSLPEGPRGLGEPRNQDFFLEPLDPSKPHITFTP